MTPHLVSFSQRKGGVYVGSYVGSGVGCHFLGMGGNEMKRYHVISISVLLGLVAGLSVSKAANAKGAEVFSPEGNKVVCAKSFGYVNGSYVVISPVTVSTSPGFARFEAIGASVPFTMQRVINDVWNKSEGALYEGEQKDLGSAADLQMTVFKGGKDINVIYSYKASNGDTLKIYGLKCSNAK